VTALSAVAIQAYTDRKEKLQQVEDELAAKFLREVESEWKGLVKEARRFTSCGKKRATVELFAWTIEAVPDPLYSYEIAFFATIVYQECGGKSRVRIKSLADLGEVFVEGIPHTCPSPEPTSTDWQDRLAEAIREAIEEAL